MIPKSLWTALAAVAVWTWWVKVGDDLWVDLTIRRLLRQHERAMAEEESR